MRVTLVFSIPFGVDVLMTILYLVHHDESALSQLTLLECLKQLSSLTVQVKHIVVVFNLQSKMFGGI